MKTLLIPTLALALACLPALAQETAAPKATPSSADTSFGAPQQKEGVSSKQTEKSAIPAPVSPILPNTIKLVEATINEVTQYLNRLLEKMGAEPLNVVVEAELSDLKVPSMTLKNVSAIDVLNVITKVSSLSLEAVPSDSGRTVAWVITRPKVTTSMGGLSLGIVSGAMGGGGGGMLMEGVSDSGNAAPSAGSTPQPGPQSTGAESASSPAGGVGSLSRLPIMGRLFTGAAAPNAGGTAGNVVWVDPAAGTSAQAQVTRVLGIARNYVDVENESERADKEAMLVKTLREITEQQNMHCDVRLYAALHVIVVKGNREAVELVEQTISALKENLWGKKSDWGSSKSSSGIRP